MSASSSISIPRPTMEFVQLALREELSKLRPVLPPGLRPAVAPFVPEDFQVNPFLPVHGFGDRLPPGAPRVDQG